MYSYDSYGWLVDAGIHGRKTGLAPPAHGAKIVGQPYPNWTGVEWVMVAYSVPVLPAHPNLRKAEILARLAEIDTITDKPRTRRELALNKQATKDWIQTLDTEAATLRTELGGLL